MGHSMNQKSPDEITQRWDSEDMNRVVRRLGDAGWLTGVNVIRPECSTVQYSAKGKSAMVQMCKLVTSGVSEFFGLALEPAVPKSLVFSKMFSLVCKDAPELVAQPLTQRESLAFVALVFMFAFKHEFG